MDVAQFYQSLADFILRQKKSDRSLIVGINGVDGSGKTILAENLGMLLKQVGHPVVRVSVDNFHHPKKYRYRRGEESPEAYYYDSINYEAFADKALRPVFQAQVYPIQCQTKYFDLAQDKEEAHFQTVDKNTIVLAEGVFIFRPEIHPFLHVKIFVDARFETILERVKVRDIGTLGSEENIQKRYMQKYIPGQKIYFEDVNPVSMADVVINNNDFANPKISFF